MKEAAYTSEYAERLKAQSEIPLGNLIIHDKNRYHLECSLAPHSKRGHKHMWEVQLSIESDDDSLPGFKDVRIIDRRNSIIRSGAVLEQEKGRSQVICAGEIYIGEKVSPLVLDLILDISYVSTTKCETVEIKPVKATKVGKYTLMNCRLYIS